MKRQLYLPGVLGTLVALLLPLACSPAEEYCDERCDCELCNDREYDTCIISKEADIDEADAYDCADDYDAYHQCYIDRANCNNHHWGPDPTDCNAQYDDWQHCRESASSLDDSYTSSGVGGYVNGPY